MELLWIDRIVQPLTSIASLDQAPSSGVGLEALEEPQNPCGSTPEKRSVPKLCRDHRLCARKGPWRMSKVKWVNIALPDGHFESLGLSFPWI